MNKKGMELLREAHDFGQFADDFDQPLAKPIRAAIREIIENSRADALTEVQRRTLQSALDLFVAMGHAPGSDHVRTLAGMLAKPSSSHPAAAPIPVGTIATFSGKHGLTWAVDPETLPEGTQLYGGPAFAPSPADERVAFEAMFPVPPDCIWTGNGYSQTRHDAWRAQAYAKMWEGWQARAASANEIKK